MTNELRIVVTGGGTGGHIEPIVAVIEHLKQSEQISIWWLGEIGGQEQQAAEALGVEFLPIKAGKLRRYLAWRNLTDPFKVGLGYFRSLRILAKIKPDVLFSKAGYVSAPVLLAASTLGIPIVAHESDTVLGMTNSFAAQVAKVVCTGFPLRFYSKMVQHKARYTGNPVRTYQSKTADPKKAAKVFHFDPKVPVVVVFGGSQGALAINQAVWNSLPHLLSAAQVIHQTGPAHIEKAHQVARELPADIRARYIFNGYFDAEHLGAALSLASLSVSRAGANTLADLSTFGIPAIFVPLPRAAANHQQRNAEYVEQAGGGIVLSQSELTPEVLYTKVETLLHDSKKLQHMGKEMKGINPADAAGSIAQIVVEQAKK